MTLHATTEQLDGFHTEFDSESDILGCVVIVSREEANQL